MKRFILIALAAFPFYTACTASPIFLQHLSARATMTSAPAAKSCASGSILTGIHNLSVAFYNVKQAGLDGSFSYSPIRSLHPAVSNAIPVTMNSLPQAGIMLPFAPACGQDAEVKVLSTNGNMAGPGIFSRPSGQIIMNAPAHNGGFTVVM